MHNCLWLAFICILGIRVTLYKFIVMFIGGSGSQQHGGTVVR